jgi:hypothetical protein
MYAKRAFPFAILPALLLAGCGTQTSEPDAAGTQAADASYLATVEPSGAQDVIAARESVEDGDEVTVVGRIGGSVDPWIDGRAAFTIVDPSLKACSDIPGDSCPTPWDYCCEASIGESSATVKVVDEKGNLVKADARELLNVKELDTVVVQGKAQRDEAGNLTVLAEHVFVRPPVVTVPEKGPKGKAHDHEHEHHEHEDHEHKD